MMNDRQPTSSDHHSVYRRALEWVDRHHADVSRDARRGHGPGPLSTSLAIYLRMHLQAFREVSDHERLSWGGYLKTCQQIETGFFVDPGLRIPGVAGGIGSADDDDPLAHLVTCFSLQALKLLGTPTASGLHFMEALDDPRAIEAWLEISDWSNAALQSERMMCVLSFLIHRAEQEQRPSALRLYHRILDWCEGTQDSKTGLIGVTPHNFPLHSIVATDRLVPFYSYVHRPIQRVAQIVNTLLSLQGADDALARSRGSAREALAAINLLGLVGRQSTYRSAVQDALVRSHAAIVAMQREDGSFPDTRSPIPESHLFDAPALLAAVPPVDGLLSLWMRVLTLTIIEHRYPDAFPAPGQWQFHAWPGLGYHASSGTLTNHERRVLPQWIRPTAYPDQSRADAVPSSPAVTVVIPCYNLGHYLHEAVESVLAQSFPDFEIIVVDDGSTDEYTRLLLEHLDRPKTTIRRQANQGVAAARNNGIRAGTGRYICCLDPDDRLRAGFLATAVAILDSHADVGLVSGSVAEFDEREQIIRRDACVLVDLLTENPIVEPAVFRRQAWEKAGGYYPGFSASGIEDWDLWLSMLEGGYRAEVIPDVVWEYRIHSDQMSTAMNQPATWEQLLRGLVSRHLDSYHEHLPDIVGRMAVQFARMRSWAAECRAGSLWWERQAGNWEHQAGHVRRDAEALEALATKADQIAVARQARITELEALAARADQTSAAQQARIAELERERTARDQAAQSPQTRMAEVELSEERRTVRSQEARIAELERELRMLDEKRPTRRVSRWLAKIGRSQHDRSE
jgi:glycosyl transferase family 2